MNPRKRARELGGRLVRRMPQPVRRAVRRRVVEAKRASSGPDLRPLFTDHRWQGELATNEYFTAPDLSEVERLEQVAGGKQSRHFMLSGVALTLREPEIASIRAHGIVRLAPEKLASHETPPPGVAFVTVTNDKYAPGVEALILSLLRQYPEMTSDVVVFHDDSLSEFSIGRMRRLYGHLRFEHRSTQPYDVGQIGSSVNHRRVGLLGYLSLEILTLDGYERAILLDADTIVLGDISRLWQGDAILAVADHGVLPFGVVAGATGLPVVNSGMISFPRSELGAEVFEKALAALPSVDHPVDPLLDNFADQKFWNVYLAQRGVEFVPVNFNTNKALVDRHFPDVLPDVALLHMTGPKPWYDFSDQDLVTDDDRNRLRIAKEESPSTIAIWNQLYISSITASRVRSFHAECGPLLESLRDSAGGRPTVLIGNGPSLQRTDLSLFEGFEKFGFNWFVHHDDFDAVRPENLVLASHMFFGGWHTARPSVPREFLDALTRHEHRPRIWTSWYFKDVVEATPELDGYEKGYFLFEKPLKVPVARRGTVQLDVLKPLTDANTGVLTAGVPIALWLGARDLVLVGCDSDYASASGSYFYDSEQHTSRTTDENQLVSTWAASGAGQYGYHRYAQELAARGVRLVDATVDGKIVVLPKMPLSQVRSLLEDESRV